MVAMATGESDLFAFVLSVVRDFSLADEAMRKIAGGTSPKDAIARATRKKPVALSAPAIEGIERAREAVPAAGWPEAVRACLSETGPYARSVLAMRYRDGLSVPDIARRTKSRNGQVQAALCRARRALLGCVETRRA
jgi:DNA-directed RNA polymerase specialized sigma24 family protein